MLERILLRNFQTHHRLIIDLAPTITTIVGSSDVGKSAIIRALRWVCTNTPQGDGFVRHGTKKAGVQLVVDGHTIKRIRGASQNTYQLDDAEYKAFGRGVPEPVERLLNMGPVCWQGQHDAPFWFAETAGEVSRQLNAIVDLGIIDKALTNVAQALRQARAKLAAAEEELANTEEEKNSLDWVPRFVADVDEVEAVEAAHAQAAQDAACAASLVEDVRTYQQTAKRAARATLAGQDAVLAGESALVLAEQVQLLENLIETAHKLTSAAKTRVPDLAPVERAFDAYTEIVTRGKSLKTLINTIKNTKDALCQREKKLKTMEAQLPKICPTCGQFWSPTSTSNTAHR